MTSERQHVGSISVFGEINFESNMQESIITNIIHEKTKSIVNILDLFGKEDAKISEVPQLSTRLKRKNKENYKISSTKFITHLNLPLITKENNVINSDKNRNNQISLKKNNNTKNISYQKTDFSIYYDKNFKGKKLDKISLKKIGPRNVLNVSTEKTRNNNSENNSLHKSNLKANFYEVFRGVYQECINGEKRIDKTKQEIVKLNHKKNFSNMEKFLHHISINSVQEEMKSLIGLPILETSRKVVYTNENESKYIANNKYDKIKKFSDKLSYKLIRSEKELGKSHILVKNKKNLHSYVHNLINNDQKKKKDLMNKLYLRKSENI